MLIFLLLLVFFADCRPSYEFTCLSGDECIAIYDKCNGIAQCDDGSDEDPQICGGENAIPTSVYTMRGQGIVVLDVVLPVQIFSFKAVVLELIWYFTTEK